MSDRLRVCAIALSGVDVHASMLSADEARI